MQRLGQMRGLALFTPCQIRNRMREFQHVNRPEMALSFVTRAGAQVREFCRSL